MQCRASCIGYIIVQEGNEKMKRRIISVFLCTLIAVSALSETAHAAAAQPYGESQEAGITIEDEGSSGESEESPQPGDEGEGEEGDVPPGETIVLPNPDEAPIVPNIAVTPEVIPAGASDPVISVFSNIPFAEWAEKCVSLELEGTGLTLASVTVDYENRNGGMLNINLHGVAQEGYIRGVIDGYAFLTENAMGTEFSVEIEASKREEATCTVIFIANNGGEKNGIAEVEIGHEYTLPDYAFQIPEGKEFIGWSIDEDIYFPGEKYVFYEDTIAIAILQDIKPKKDEKQEKIDSVVRRIEEYIAGMTDDEKEDPDCIDLATLYAETVAEDVVRKTVSGSTVSISATAIFELMPLAEEVYAAAEHTLKEGNVYPARELMKTVALDCSSSNIKVDIDKSILSAGVDKVSVKTQDYGLTFKTSDLKPDLEGGMTVTAEKKGTKAAPQVKVTLPNDQMTNSVIVSFPSEGDSSAKHVVQDSEGSTIVSKRNPFKNAIEGKVNTSGTYGRGESEKDFSDIGRKSQEMQTAIKYLASMGVINGTTPTTFSPDASISRAEIAKLLVSALGKLDSTATTSFSDVTKKNWYYSVAASSQKHGLVKGFEDNTFRGTQDISKVQIVALASRVLTSEMKYKAPQAASKYLAKYSDEIPQWAQSEVALATKENLVVLRKDGTFAGEKSMTRGDAAIVIYRLFQRIW